MENIQYISSPSLYSSPSTKEQSTEQPKSSEHKSMEDENKLIQNESNIQQKVKTKKLKKSEELEEEQFNVQQFNEDDSHEDYGEEYESKGFTSPERQSSNEQQQIQTSSKDKDQIDEDNDEEYDEDDIDHREGDSNSDTTLGNFINNNTQNFQFSKEFLNIIRQNSEELRKEKVDQNLEYLFVIDFECNQPCSEIIEFPITVIDLNQKKVVDQFHSYVRPTKVKKLSKFIRNLTGIKQKDVDTSEDIKTVLSSVEAFLNKYKNHKAAVLYDCSNDAKFLSDEIKNKQINVECKFLFSYINLRNVFPLNLTGGIKNISLSHALEVLDMSFEGQKHTGRDDAINIARVCIEMVNRSFVFTSFMRQSQFCSDIPKKMVDSNMNDLFQLNKYIIAIDIQFYGDKKELNSKNTIIHCKSFNLHLYQKSTKTLSSSSYNTPPIQNNSASSTPQKKLKSVAEKIAEQQQKQGNSTEKQLITEQQYTQKHLENNNCQTPTAGEQKQQQQKQYLQKQSSMQLSYIEEIDSFSKEFNDMNYQFQDYYVLLQGLVELYNKYGIKNRNSLIILNFQTKQKYFSKFFKFITSLFQISKTDFIFKKKVLNLSEILEKQIQIDKAYADTITYSEFPQNVISLVDYFHNSNFEVKELPSTFARKNIGLQDQNQAQPSNYQRDFNQYLYQFPQQPYSQFVPYSQQMQQIPQNMELLHSNQANVYNQLQVMYNMQAQNAYSQQTVNAFMNQPQTQYPFYYQAMNQMNNNLIYQISLMNSGFSFPQFYEGQHQQQAMYQMPQQQQYDQAQQQLSEKNSLLLSERNQQQLSDRSYQQTIHPQVISNQQSQPQISTPQQASLIASNNFKNSSNYQNSPNNYKSNPSSIGVIKNEGSNFNNTNSNSNRKKNFRNNSHAFNTYNPNQNSNNQHYFNSNNTSQNFQRSQNLNKNNSSNLIVQSSLESNHNYSQSTSASVVSNFNSPHQNQLPNYGFSKSSTYNNSNINNNSNISTNNKNKTYKK